MANWSPPEVRIKVSKSMPPEMAAYIPASVKVADADIYWIDGPLNLSAFFKIAGLDRPDLKDKPIRHSVPHVLESSASAFDAIRNQDILPHHPYMPYSRITDLICEASEDHDVLAIKMCLYRIGGNSPIAPLLT